MHSLSLNIRAPITAVFSLAYLRQAGPTTLQNRILFDVGNGDNTKPLMWL